MLAKRHELEMAAVLDAFVLVAYEGERRIELHVRPAPFDIVGKNINADVLAGPLFYYSHRFFIIAHWDDEMRFLRGGIPDIVAAAHMETDGI